MYCILGSFEERFLELPAAILTTVMRKHQRYLPVVDAEGAMLPYFVTVANGPCDRDAAAGGGISGGQRQGTTAESRDRACDCSVRTGAGAADGCRYALYLS